MGKGLHGFTVQEAENFEAFNDWNYEQLDLGTTLGDWVVAQHITSADPAKQVIIYPKPGVTMDNDETLSLYINDTLTNSGSKINMGSNINDSATALVVDDETDFSAGDVILVDAELLYVSAVTSDSSHSLTVTRAYGQSIAAAHLNNAILWKVGLPGKHSASASSRPLIRVDTDQLPFTLSGLMITNLYVLNSGAEGNTDDDVSVLSFH